MLAFMLHRITGLGLVFYLFLHLALLNQLRQGPEAWNGFLQVMRSPWVTVLDAMLLLGILIHGLNGLRLTLVGFGLFVRQQKWMFWAALAVAVVVGAVGVGMMR
jgi:succinate dehydrogenase / fumarate reductase cytochrome b subunit